MGDWLKRKLVGIALTAMVFAGWWGYDKITGGGSSSKELDKTPSVVFGGGAGKLVVDVSMNNPGYLTTSFSHGDDDDDDDSVHATENLEAGDHLFSIDLPADLTYGYFELQIPNARVGDKLAWTVRFEDRTVMREDETLDQPLGENQAFFLQLEFSDLKELRSYAR